MKYRHICIYIYLLLSMYFFVGCEKDWLGAKANRQQAIPSTLKDFQAILNGEALNSESGSTIAELASDGHSVSEAAWAASSSDLGLNAYTWSNDRPYGKSNWTVTFSRVFSANIVLDAVNIYTPANEEEKLVLNNIKGQALFHRADAFYRAAQIWASPYDPLTADKDLGMPLRLEADVTIPSMRTSVKKTYDQIINDLLEASKLLSKDFVAKTRPYSLSVFALLARVYMSMREYEKAAVYADSCMKINNSLLDFNDLSTTANFIGNVNDNPEVIFFMSFSTGGLGGFLTTACLIDSNLFALYDPNDLRRKIFFKANTNGTITYKGNYNNSATTLFCGLAVDEIYLIRAECYARAGETMLAMKYLNDLLRTRWKKVDGVSTYVDQVASDSNDALMKILTERRKELLMRGLRWTDLRRLNFEENHKERLTRTIGGNTYILEPRSFRYTFPIPLEIISRSEMQQNPGW